LPLEQQDAGHRRAVQLGQQHHNALGWCEGLPEILEERTRLREHPILPLAQPCVQRVEAPDVIDAASDAYRHPGAPGMAYIATRRSA
jgi:hypothetical protein